MSAPSQPQLVSATLQLLPQVMPLTLGEFTRWRVTVEPSYAHARTQVEQIRSTLSNLFAAPPPLMTEQRQAHVANLESRMAQRTEWVQYVEDTVKNRADLESLIVQATVMRSPMLVLRALVASLDYCASALFGEEPGFDDIKHVREWMKQADPLLQAFVESITLEQVRDTGAAVADLVSMMACVGALHLVPSLQRMADCACQPLQSRVNYLSQLAEQPDMHFIDVTPFLALFSLGLDPTIVDTKLSPALSPIERARVFVAENPEEDEGVVNPELWMQPALVNLVPAYIAQQALPSEAEEEQRQEALHRRFLRAMVPAWKAHSAIVRSMLFEAAEDRLIPPLVEICAGYLDLERR